MKLSELRKILDNIEHEMFIYGKMNLPMGTVPEEPDVYVGNDGKMEDPILFYDSKDNKIYL